MVVITASRFDAGAQSFAANASSIPASVLTAEDLSRPGWIFQPGRGRHSVAIIDGNPTPATDITAVVDRLPAVTAAELPHVAGHDQEYVAAEMTAFLDAWLSELPCPVLNPRTLPSASGWRSEKWLLMAKGAGLATGVTRRRADPSVDERSGDLAAAAEYVTVSVVGEEIVGIADEATQAGLRRLAAGAGVRCLTARLETEQEHMRFVGAWPWLDMLDPEVTAALTRQLPR